MEDKYSISKIRTFQSCPRKFWFNYRKGYREKSISIPRMQGILFGNILQEQYNGVVVDREGNVVGDKDPFSEAYRSETNTYIRHKMYVAREVSKIMAEAYLLRYKQIDEGVVRECGFEVSINGNTFVGFIDGVKMGEYLVEDKLLNPRFFGGGPIKALALDGQVTAYLLAARDLGFGTDRLLFRTTFKPQLRQRVSERDDDFLQRIRDDVFANTSKYLRQYELFRDDIDFEDMENLVSSIDRMISMMDNEAHYPANTSSCGEYGGCPFLGACTRSEGWEKDFTKEEHYGE